MLNRKIRISYRVLVIMFLLFPMIKFDEKAITIWIGGQFSKLINNVLVLWNMLSLVIIIMLFLNKLIRHGTKFVKIYTWLALVFVLAFAVSTMTMSSYVGIYNIIREIGNIAALFMLANIFSDKNYTYFLQGFYYYITAIMFAAALTIYLMAPAYTNSNGSAYYLYGLDNVSFLYSMNGFFAGTLYHLMKDGKLNLSFLLTYLFIGGAYVYSGTGTGTVVFLLCIIFVLVYENRRLNLLNYRMVLFLCTLLFVFLVFVQNISVFSSLLGLIGKDTTMSGRTILWSAALREFPKHKFMGIGISASLLGNILVSQGVNWGAGIGHLHNIVIEILFRGGIVSLAIYVFMWLGCYKSVRRAEKKTIGNSFLCMLLIQFLAYMFEYRFVDISYWILLLSGYHLLYLSENSKRMESADPTVLKVSEDSVACPDNGKKKWLFWKRMIRKKGF